MRHPESHVHRSTVKVCLPIMYRGVLQGAVEV